MIERSPKACLGECHWEKEPHGMIYINYCDEKTLDKIINKGKIATKKDGFMEGIQVG
jgi:hypothetical protein